jgi:glycerol-3-phosphate acyltransferase PlsY
VTTERPRDTIAGMPGTNDTILWVCAIAAAYLIGSIPVGVIIGRLRGVDIRAHGSRNVGATNVSRVLGRRLGMLCFALDSLKGVIPVLAAGLATGMLGREAGDTSATELWLWLAVAAAAVFGHMFSIFLGFRGGKGVATGFGAMLGMWPWLTAPAVAAFAVWILVALRFRFVSLASMTAASILPVATILWLVVLDGGRGREWAAAVRAGGPLIAMTALLACIVIWRHRANIARLRAGTEPRMGASRGTGVSPVEHQG